MYQKATRMILTAVVAVIVVLGLPAMILGGMLAWRTEESALTTRALTVTRAVERRLAEDSWVTQSVVAAWARPVGSEPHAYVEITITGRYRIVSGERPKSPVMSVSYSAVSGVHTTVEISAIHAIRSVVLVELALVAGIVASLLLAWRLANRMARRLSAPLIYLAAQAEQIGSGQVRAQVRASGIEEIDLVQEELARTGERMARRLAAERQHSADASHQLRTPLTALSMRLEEIQYLSSEPEVQQEAEVALGQVERMTTVVEDLLDATRRTDSNTEVVQLLEVFNTELEEWGPQFARADRKLVFVDEAAQLVLAEQGKLAQILAILLENSLRYGDGTTEVKARRSGSSRAILIDVSDQGQGIADEAAEDIFDMGFSTGGSSGIGLALAKDLAQSMGARLELSHRVPAVFTLSLSAIPANFDPNVVMPQAPLVSVGRRARRL